MSRTILSATASTCAVLFVAGCSPAGSVKDTFNDSDVRYAEDVISTHQRAIGLADIARSKSRDPLVRKVVAATDAEMQPEIEMVTALSRSWADAKPTNYDASTHLAEADAPLLRGRNETTGLSELQGQDFDEAFLLTVVAHSREEVVDAETQVENGRNNALVGLARSIASERLIQIRDVAHATSD